MWPDPVSKHVRSSRLLSPLNSPHLDDRCCHCWKRTVQGSQDADVDPKCMEIPVSLRSWQTLWGVPHWKKLRFFRTKAGVKTGLLLETEYTSSTAQGGGGSFKNRKPIGEVGCCESGMAERSHWRTERCLRSPLFLSLSLAIYLPTHLFSMYLSICWSSCLSLSFPLSSHYLSTYLPIYLSTYPPIHLSTYPPIHLSTYPPIHLSTYPPIYLSTYLPIYLSTYLSIYLSIYLSLSLSFICLSV